MILYKMSTSNTREVINKDSIIFYASYNIIRFGLQAF